MDLIVVSVKQNIFDQGLTRFRKTELICPSRQFAAPLHHSGASEARANGATMARENKLLARVSKTKFAVVGKRTAKFFTSRLFVMRFDWDYLVIACSLAVICAAFILFLAM